MNYTNLSIERSSTTFYKEIKDYRAPCMATKCKECTATEGGKAPSAFGIYGSLLHRNSRGGILHSQPLIPGARSCVSAEKVIPNYPYRNIEQVSLCTSKSNMQKLGPQV